LLALLCVAVTRRAALGGRSDRSLALASVNPRMCTGMASSTALLTALVAVMILSIERSPALLRNVEPALNPPILRQTA